MHVVTHVVQAEVPEPPKAPQGADSPSGWTQTLHPTSPRGGGTQGTLGAIAANARVGRPRERLSVTSDRARGETAV